MYAVDQLQTYVGRFIDISYGRILTQVLQRMHAKQAYRHHCQRVHPLGDRKRAHGIAESFVSSLLGKRLQPAQGRAHSKLQRTGWLFVVFTLVTANGGPCRNKGEAERSY